MKNRLVHAFLFCCAIAFVQAQNPLTADEQAAVLKKSTQWPEKKRLFEAFEKNYPEHESLEALTRNFLPYDFIENNDVEGLRGFIAARPAMFDDPNLLSVIAEYMLRHNKGVYYAEELTRQAVALFPDWYEPVFTDKEEWVEHKRKVKPSVVHTYAAIMTHQKRYGEAYELLKQTIHEWEGGSSPQQNEVYVLCAVESQHLVEAKAGAEQFIRSGRSTPKIITMLREMYIAENGSDSGYNTYLATLEAEARTRRQEEIRKAFISVPAPDFLLRDTKGRPVSLADLKGKVVVLDFWATWCGPCISLFPAMKLAKDKFHANPGVVFLFINTIEARGLRLTEAQTAHRAAEFMAKKQYDFTVPVDWQNRVYEAYEVKGIPTKFIIDREGNIRHKSVGYRPGYSDEQIADELILTIEMIAGMQK